MKRPAAASRGSSSRRARVEEASSGSVARCDPVEEGASGSMACSLAGGALMSPSSAEEVEAALGARYRREVSDLGLGLGRTHMKRQLLSWGYDVSLNVCLSWLSLYQVGDGAQDGGASIFARSREQLRRWYYVDQLRGRFLQDKYRQVCGVYANIGVLQSWLMSPLQAPEMLQNNVDMHSHACGEYVLSRLQAGEGADAVADMLLQEYLVQATRQRVTAYRKYREQIGEYMTLDKVEYDHWDSLYVSFSDWGLQATFLGNLRHGRKKQLEAIRETLCGSLGIAEAYVSL